MSSKNPIFAILWLILLLVIAWPVAGFLAGVWLLLQPFEALFPFVKEIQTLLEKWITWPRECGHAILDCRSNPPLPAH